MQKNDIRVGEYYAFRQKRLPGEQLQKVKILHHLRGNKWKAEWVEPTPGLVDYVESAQLVALWNEHKAFLKEEESREKLLKRNHELGYSENSPIASALYEIFESVGEPGVSFYKGCLRGSPEAIDRVRTRAGMNFDHHSMYAFTDRQGTLFLPFDEAHELAKRFCAAEPQTILVKVEAGEREFTQQARTAGEEYMVPLLNEFQASWAIIRQWAGHEPAVAAREEHIKMLERLVWDAIYALQKAGLDSEAARLRRAIDRKS